MSKPKPKAKVKEPSPDMQDMMLKIEQSIRLVRAGASAARQFTFALVAGIPDSEITPRMRHLLNELKADETHYQSRRAQWQE